MADVFELQGKITIDNTDANEKIDETTKKAKDLGDELNGTGQEADGMAGKIGEGSGFSAAAYFMASLLVDLAEKAAGLATNLAKTGIGFAAEMEQNLGGVQTLFGSAAEIVYRNAANAYKTAGMSANDYMQTITSFAAALKQSVGSEAEAATVADMAVVDMSDNANKMGTSMESIMNAYQGFAKQNYTMLDNLKLGYGGTKGEMERLLADASKLAGTEFNIDSLSDVFNAIHVIQEELGITGTTAQEASTTLSGSAATAKTAWENFLTDAFLQAIPKLTEGINKIIEWMDKNPDKVQEFAKAISDFASVSFGAATGFLEWLLDNGEEISTIIKALAAAFAIGAIAAHPYAAAIMAVVAGLAALAANNADGDSYDHFFAKYSDEDLQKLQNWVDAVNEVKAVEQAAMDAWEKGEDTSGAEAAIEQANARRDAAFEEANAIDGLIEAYNAWRNGQAENAGKDLYLDVPLKLEDGAEKSVQGELNGFSLQALVHMVPDYSQIQNAGAVTGVSLGVNGSHASGLDRVPHDGYIARLHKDEAVLNASQADVWRGGGMMGGTGRLEGMMAQLLGVMGQVAANTSGGQQIVLDSGALVGQLAPQIDTQLGTLNTRKGRRN